MHLYEYFKKDILGISLLLNKFALLLVRKKKKN